MSKAASKSSAAKAKGASQATGSKERRGKKSPAGAASAAATTPRSPAEKLGVVPPAAFGFTGPSATSPPSGSDNGGGWHTRAFEFAPPLFADPVKGDRAPAGVGSEARLFDDVRAPGATGYFDVKPPAAPASGFASATETFGPGPVPNEPKSRFAARGKRDKGVNKQPCRFFATGVCLSGAQCEYSHGPNPFTPGNGASFAASPSADKAVPAPIDPNTPPPPDFFTQTFPGYSGQGRENKPAPSDVPAFFGQATPDGKKYSPFTWFQAPDFDTSPSSTTAPVDHSAWASPPFAPGTSEAGKVSLDDWFPPPAAPADFFPAPTEPAPSSEFDWARPPSAQPRLDPTAAPATEHGVAGSSKSPEVTAAHSAAQDVDSRANNAAAATDVPAADPSATASGAASSKTEGVAPTAQDAQIPASPLRAAAPVPGDHNGSREHQQQPSAAPETGHQAAAPPVSEIERLAEQRMRAEMETQRVMHELTLAKNVGDAYKARLDALEAELVQARTQCYMAERSSSSSGSNPEIEQARAAAAAALAEEKAKNAHLSETLLDLKAALRQERHQWNATLDELHRSRLAEQRLQREAESRATEARDARAREREAQEQLKALAGEKERLERIGEIARVRETALRDKERAARAELATTVVSELQSIKPYGLRKFLRHVYERHPPKDANARLGSLDAGSLDKTAKLSLQHYHPDRCDVDMHGLMWKVTCTEIAAILNELREAERLRK